MPRSSKAIGGWKREVLFLVLYFRVAELYCATRNRWATGLCNERTTALAHEPASTAILTAAQPEMHAELQDHVFGK
jgi:hypothetical protein